MQVVRAGPFHAVCEARGTQREVSLLMLPGEPPRPGDFVLVHLGHAMERISAEAAREAWDVLDLLAPPDRL